MSATFGMPIDNETLNSEELIHITGCVRKSDQIQWLSSNGWVFHKNKAGEAIVGRLYTRLKLSGITPSSMTMTGTWTPDFSGIR
ncbi:MAG: DUF4224 domain-containing protein [Ottowia sp.]|nr:DUF4224 domain-containing protein [Ottowia sp.]